MRRIWAERPLYLVMGKETRSMVSVHLPVALCTTRPSTRISTRSVLRSQPPPNEVLVFFLGKTAVAHLPERPGFSFSRRSRRRYGPAKDSILPPLS